MSQFRKPGRRAPRITASFDSVCPCGLDISEGDDVYKVDGEWVCESCACGAGVC